MQIRYYKEYSRFLNRFMEFKVYGHAGRPIVIFPCQSGRFFDWEDRNMCNAAAPWIDSGKLQIFTVDSIDPESWDNNGPERPRIEMQERWYNYICERVCGGHRVQHRGQRTGVCVCRAADAHFYRRLGDRRHHRGRALPAH